jgi:hypothetical protein
MRRHAVSVILLLHNVYYSKCVQIILEMQSKASAVGFNTHMWQK